MSSIVKMGTAIYLKVSETLDRGSMDELNDIHKEFEKSGHESFVFDFSNLKLASVKACQLLTLIQAVARKKGKVFVLAPIASEIHTMLLELKTIKPCEVYENRNLIGQAMKNRVRGNIPEL